MIDFDVLKRDFSPHVIKWRAKKVTKDKRRALAVPYIDARDVMERLDDATGETGWSDRYTIIHQVDSTVSVECELTLGNMKRADVGTAMLKTWSGGDSAEDLYKTAYSDALKRAAVKFGVGRSLYQIKPIWVDYDEKTKQVIMPAAPIDPPPNKAKKPINKRSQQKPTEMNGPDPSQPVLDLWSQLDEKEKAANGLTWRDLARVMVGPEHYRAYNHVYNAAKYYPQLPAGMEITADTKLSLRGAKNIAHWLYERKVKEEIEELNGELFPD